jgi:hypothetical protein
LEFETRNTHKPRLIWDPSSTIRAIQMPFNQVLSKWMKTDPHYMFARTPEQLCTNFKAVFTNHGPQHSFISIDYSSFDSAQHLENK